jgi:hypothetical protein
VALLYYTLTGIVLYLLADWLLNQVEIRRGKRLEYRALIFFAILLTLALLSFQIIERLTAPTEPPPASAPGDILTR